MTTAHARPLHPLASLDPVDPLDRERVRSVLAMVRRRVPASEVEDVTQNVLCDAVAASRLPSEPTELRRFLCVLTRNKIADYHRRARRTTSAELCEGIAPAPPIEARSLLQRVIGTSSPRDRETLEWLVREHDGEELREIANDVGLPAPTVRKRVSRLRQVLRAQWAHAMLVLLAAGAAGAGAHHAIRDDAPVITADPEAEPGARVIALGQGRWRVAEGATLEHASLGTIDARALEIRITGRRVEVLGPLGSLPGMRETWTITSTRLVDDATFALELRDDQGHVQHATVTLRAADGNGDADVMTLAFERGALRGAARLTR